MFTCVVLGSQRGRTPTLGSTVSFLFTLHRVRVAQTSPSPFPKTAGHSWLTKDRNSGSFSLVSLREQIISVKVMNDEVRTHVLWCHLSLWGPRLVLAGKAF